MSGLNDFFAGAAPLFTQLNFWVTVLVTLLVWYGLSVGLAHMLFGAGNRAPIHAARQGMTLALLLVIVVLACGAWFLFQPSDLVYLIAITVTTLILTLLVLAVFTRLGKEN